MTVRPSKCEDASSSHVCMFVRWVGEMGKASMAVGYEAKRFECRGLYVQKKKKVLYSMTHRLHNTDTNCVHPFPPAQKYVPSAADVLRMRHVTRGLVQHTFDLSDLGGPLGCATWE